MPPAPAFPEDHAHTEQTTLRYEDVAQDGRLIPIALPVSMSALWQLMRNHPAQRAALARGILPIMTRMTLVSIDAPIRVDQPVEARAGFQLAHDMDPDGEARIFLNVWSELHGAAGRMRSGPPGPPVRAGHLFASHTFTRLFAPPGQRRVSQLDVEGFPAVPHARHEAPAATTAAEAPAGARWLEELAPDPAEVAFTLDQTDSNQHVNSLVYVRVFLDAVQRRLAAAGRPLAVLSRAVDIAYRKPCFAGDRVRAHLRLFGPADAAAAREPDAGGGGGEGDADGGVGGGEGDAGGGSGGGRPAGLIGAAGFIAGPGEEARPRCYIRVLLSP